MSETSTITCVGEILWDALPAGLFLGGAPLNVCLNLNQLGEEATIVSRVGTDRLGNEALRRLKTAGLNTDFIQKDDSRETGFVKVELGSEGDPDYEIIQPVAWDFIDLSDNSIRNLLQHSWAVVYGTLAHRANPSLKGLLDLECLKALDMNLRSPHYEKDQVVQLVEHSDLLKMNEAELGLLQKWCSLPAGMEEAVSAISKRFGCRTVCVTMGGKGSALFHDNKWFEHPGYRTEVVDAVGAGDAFFASLLYGLRSGRDEDQLLPLANAAGAYVAARPGANPEYSVSDLESIMQGSHSPQ